MSDCATSKNEGNGQGEGEGLPIAIEYTGNVFVIPFRFDKFESPPETSPDLNQR